MSYTKGPWKCDAASFTDSDAVAYEVSADDMTISAANAWLIAAAPDMAEALRRLCSMFAHVDEKTQSVELWGDQILILAGAVNQARAALAKAGL